jgi:predicted MFS family arabinose efflux permease
MTDQLEFSIKESGLVLSFYGVGSVIGSWLGGYFTDKFGEYRVQSTSLFLSAPLFTNTNLYFGRRDGSNYSAAKYYK